MDRGVLERMNSCRVNYDAPRPFFGDPSGSVTAINLEGEWSILKSNLMACSSFPSVNRVFTGYHLTILWSRQPRVPNYKRVGKQLGPGFGLAV